MRYKEKYKAGMIFRSEKYPWADIVIESVCYDRECDSADDFNYLSYIDWRRINEIEFDKYICKIKGYSYEPEPDGRMDFRHKTTFPYAFYGQMNQRSMDKHLRKYELVYIGMSDAEICMEIDNEKEYYAVLENY